jgi:hypothetical protein
MYQKRRLKCIRNIHRLGAESGSDHINFPATDLTLDVGLGSRAPIDDFHLDGSILLRPMSLSVLTVVIHAGLTVLGAVDGISLAEFDLAQLVEFVDLPADEGVVIWIGFGGEEGAAPVYTRSERSVICLFWVSIDITDWRLLDD